MPAPYALVVMGPAGAGKSTTAALLAETLRWPFAEADIFHPAINIERMKAGIPLTDDDRWPWLAELRGWIERHAGEGLSCVLTCSALKRSYRDFLCEATAARVRFVALELPPAILRERLGGRSGHYMPPEMLASQLADYEPLADDEEGLRISSLVPADAIVQQALAHFGLIPR